MNNVGLFIVSYEISTGLMGAPSLRADLVVSAPSRTLTGHGHVSTDSPNFSVDSILFGEFTYMTVMPNSTHILVTAEGKASNLLGAPQNLNLRMVLTADWSGGTASFSYLDATGKWTSIENAKVTKVASNTTAPAAESLVSQN